MGSHDPFGYLKHKLWPKKGPGVKSPIWFPTTKSQESPWLLACRWHVTYHWKSLNKGYNFALKLTPIKGLHKKLCASEVAEVSILGISGLPTWDSRDKMTFGCRPLVARHREYYKGEGGGFLQVQVVGSFMSSYCPWFVRAPKVLQLCTNQLVI
jgi:hypothetical protein